jgi:hypothetical protein
MLLLSEQALTTIRWCTTCLRVVEARILLEDNHVYMDRRM